MKTCIQCKREYNPSSRHKKCPKCRKKFHKCLNCTKKIETMRKRCITCHNRYHAKKGPKNPNFKGRLVNTRGYVKIWNPNHPRVGHIIKSGHKYVYEHILVMEEHLGRYLTNGENVHHINGIKDDNRIENLELWTKPQPSGIRAINAVEWAIKTLKLYAPDKLR